MTPARAPTGKPSVTICRSAVQAAALAAGLLVPSSLPAQEFTPEQREALGGTIRDHLIENLEILREALQALDARSSRPPMPPPRR